MSALPPPARPDRPDDLPRRFVAAPALTEWCYLRAALLDIDESVAAQNAEITAKLALPSRVAQAADRLEARLPSRDGGSATGTDSGGTDDA